MTSNGNSKPVTRSFDVLCDVHLNERASKQSRCWWFETPLGSLWRHCNVMVWMDDYSYMPYGASHKHAQGFVVFSFDLLVTTILSKFVSTALFIPSLIFLKFLRKYDFSTQNFPHEKQISHKGYFSYLYHGYEMPNRTVQRKATNQSLFSIINKRIKLQAY